MLLSHTLMKIVSFDVGIKNLAYCIFDTETMKIKDWNIVDITTNKKNNECSQVVSVLDQYNNLLDSNLVLIEKQPSKNNKMRIIEALLNAYFVIKGINDKDSSISNVKVYSAKHKLGNDTFKGKVNYNQRKKLGIYKSEIFLKSNIQDTKFVELFEKSKKKDDLADSLLQALSYINFDIKCNTEEFCIQDKIISRKPTKKQEKTRYSKYNLKYIINEFKKDNNDIEEYIKSNVRLTKDINYWFKSFENSKKALGI